MLYRNNEVEIDISLSEIRHNVRGQSMKVKIYGFEWHLGKSITLDDLSFYISTKSGITTDDRLLSLHKKDGFWVGVMLTIKNMKAFCKITRDGGSFTISPQELEENTNMAHFNFFLIHPATGRGLYQHYHHSAATNTFCHHCKTYYTLLKKENIREEYKARERETPGSADMREIRNRYMGSLRYSLILKKDSFESLVSKLRNVNLFEFELSTFTDNEDIFTPASAYAKRISHRMTFDRSLGSLMSDKIKNSIMETIPMIKRGTVRGIDPDGNEEAYRLINDIDHFASYEYDEVVKTININSNNLHESIDNSYFIQEMLKLANKSPIKEILSIEAST